MGQVLGGSTVGKSPSLSSLSLSLKNGDNTRASPAGFLPGLNEIRLASDLEPSWHSKSPQQIG